MTQLFIKLIEVFTGIWLIQLVWNNILLPTFGFPLELSYGAAAIFWLAIDFLPKK